MRWRVENQVVIVTGASKGIGLATARALHCRGARVAILARDRTRLDMALASFGADQNRVAAHDVDVCKKAELVRILDQVVSRWGRIDGIVNNVGFQFARRIERMDEAEVRRIVELNFLSAVFGSQAVIPHLRKAGGGRIINISSASVRHNDEFAHLGMYSACKAGLDRFTNELREELRADNIMVTLFSPGAVMTGSLANFDPAAIAEAMTAWLERGAYCNGMIADESVVGEAIAHCFEYPPGVVVNFMEVMPSVRTPKQLESEIQRRR